MVISSHMVYNDSRCFYRYIIVLLCLVLVVASTQFHVTQGTLGYLTISPSQFRDSIPQIRGYDSLQGPKDLICEIGVNTDCPSPPSQKLERRLNRLLEQQTYTDDDGKQHLAWVFVLDDTLTWSDLLDPITYCPVYSLDCVLIHLDSSTPTASKIFHHSDPSQPFIGPFDEPTYIRNLHFIHTATDMQGGVIDQNQNYILFNHIPGSQKMIAIRYEGRSEYSYQNTILVTFNGLNCPYSFTETMYSSPDRILTLYYTVSGIRCPGSTQEEAINKLTVTIQWTNPYTINPIGLPMTTTNTMTFMDQSLFTQAGYNVINTPADINIRSIGGIGYAYIPLGGNEWTIELSTQPYTSIPSTLKDLYDNPFSLECVFGLHTIYDSYPSTRVDTGMKIIVSFSNDNNEANSESHILTHDEKIALENRIHYQSYVGSAIVRYNYLVPAFCWGNSPTGIRIVHEFNNFIPTDNPFTLMPTNLHTITAQLTLPDHIEGNIYLYKEANIKLRMRVSGLVIESGKLFQEWLDVDRIHASTAEIKANEWNVPYSLSIHPLISKLPLVFIEMITVEASLYDIDYTIPIPSELVRREIKVPLCTYPRTSECQQWTAEICPIIPPSEYYTGQLCSGFGYYGINPDTGDCNTKCTCEIGHYGDQCQDLHPCVDEQALLENCRDRGIVKYQDGQCQAECTCDDVLKWTGKTCAQAVPCNPQSQLNCGVGGYVEYITNNDDDDDINGTQTCKASCTCLFGYTGISCGTCPYECYRGGSPNTTVYCQEHIPSNPPCLCPTNMTGKYCQYHEIHTTLGIRNRSLPAWLSSSFSVKRILNTQTSNFITSIIREFNQLLGYTSEHDNILVNIDINNTKLYNNNPIAMTYLDPSSFFIKTTTCPKSPKIASDNDNDNDNTVIIPSQFTFRIVTHVGTSLSTINKDIIKVYTRINEIIDTKQFVGMMTRVCSEHNIPYIGADDISAGCYYNNNDDDISIDLDEESLDPIIEENSNNSHYYFIPFDFYTLSCSSIIVICLILSHAIL